MVEKNKLDEAKKIMLEILQEIVKICEEENIKYWLTDGTLLGAVRHKGFIPWDDDIDICMLKEDYKKFIEIASKKLNKKKYFLQTMETDNKKVEKHLKIRDRNSIFIEIGEGEALYHQGIFVDVFPMVMYSPKIKLIPKWSYNVLVKLKNMDIKRKNQKYIYLKKIILIIKIPNIAKKILDLFLNKENKNMSYIGYEYAWNQLYKFTDIFPLKKIKFENKIFSSPNNSDEVLKELYGRDYMLLPPEEERVWHAEYIEIGKRCFFEKVRSKE